MSDYKHTLNLPETDFPMRGDLPKREPARLARWQELGLYQRLREAGQGREPSCCTTARPTPTAASTSATPSTRSSRTSSSRRKGLAGFDAPYVPGWDCHGLPIEHQIEKKHGKHLPPRRRPGRCAARTPREQIAGQKADFERLGVLGDWDHPYRTMDFANEAGEIRALAEMVRHGYVYRGLKPVNWCFDCGSALAEAEVEYADKSPTPSTWPSPVPTTPGWPRPSACRSCRKPAVAVIWTTTPWTLPANQALNVHPEFSYALVDTGAVLLLAEELVESCLERFGLQGEVLATAKGEALDLIEFRHPFYDRLLAGLSGRLRDGRRRHRHRAFGAGLRRG